MAAPYAALFYRRKVALKIRQVGFFFQFYMHRNKKDFCKHKKTAPNEQLENGPDLKCPEEGEMK